ncbi:MAG: MBL fold metallo-hydrolase [Ardenticatenaceae bacterium]|nr:MBL fold metallo-hydrolase [Ardenticatenaceae bacterium]MCB9003381.1 MBL fold metallo-hydrolase [Ardenticatenaceae bacterium]
MNIHFLRNATLIIESGVQRILLDPMLGKRGTLPPYAFFRRRPQMNPTVDLPENVDGALEGVTAVLITHCRWGHFDHLDPAGWRWVAQKGLPVYSHRLDKRYLRRRHLHTIPLTPGVTAPFFMGKITPITAVHGYGLVGKLMGPGVGYFIELPDEPTLYISGDTVLTPEVRRVLEELRPDVAMLAAGTAVLDVGRPILMPLPELVEFIRLAPGQVIATHLEALNHCRTTRQELATAVAAANLQHKLIIPADGERITLNETS